MLRLRMFFQLFARIASLELFPTKRYKCIDNWCFHNRYDKFEYIL